MYKIGIDLGGTKIEGILLDEKLNVIERKRILTPKDDYKAIIDFFKENVAKAPDALAVSFEGKTITYRELDKYSNQLIRKRNKNSSNN